MQEIKRTRLWQCPPPCSFVGAICDCNAHRWGWALCKWLLEQTHTHTTAPLMTRPPSVPSAISLNEPQLAWSYVPPTYPEPRPHPPHPPPTALTPEGSQRLHEGYCRMILDKPRSRSHQRCVRSDLVPTERLVVTTYLHLPPRRSNWWQKVTRSNQRNKK